MLFAPQRAQPPTRTGRSELYEPLETVYGLYIDWKLRKIAKQSAQIFADELSIVRRKGMSPIRAMGYVYSENVSPSRIRKVVCSRGGVAGCARLAVQRKRRRPRHDCVEGDWGETATQEKLPSVATAHDL
jgi:hypothetical protein